MVLGILKMNLSWLLPGGTCRRTSRGGRSGHRRARDKPGPEREPEFRRRKSEKESAFFVQLIDRFDPKKRLEQQKWSKERTRSGKKTAKGQLQLPAVARFARSHQTKCARKRTVRTRCALLWCTRTCSETCVLRVGGNWAHLPTEKKIITTKKMEVATLIVSVGCRVAAAAAVAVVAAAVVAATYLNFLLYSHVPFSQLQCS